MARSGPPEVPRRRQPIPVEPEKGDDVLRCLGRDGRRSDAVAIGRLSLRHEWLIWSTVGINIVGSFLLGLLVAEHWFSRDVREGLGSDSWGGFTTFSTFSVRVILDIDAGEPVRAIFYVASVVGGLLAAAAGFALGRCIA